MPRAQASLPTTSWSGTPCVQTQLPARIARRISISVSLSAQSLEPSPPAAFIYSARCCLGAGNGFFFFFFLVYWTLAGFFLLWEVSLGLLQAP